MVARSIAPPIDIFPITPTADFKFLPKIEDIIATKTADPIPPVIVEPKMVDI